MELLDKLAKFGMTNARTMLGRMGEGGMDLKGAVAFLASDAARQSSV